MVLSGNRKIGIGIAVGLGALAYFIIMASIGFAAAVWMSDEGDGRGGGGGDELYLTPILTVEYLPDRIDYVQGDLLDLDGLVLRLSFEEDPYTDYLVAPYEFDELGITSSVADGEILETAGEFELVFTVTDGIRSDSCSIMLYVERAGGSTGTGGGSTGTGDGTGSGGSTRPVGGLQPDGSYYFAPLEIYITPAPGWTCSEGGGTLTITGPSGETKLLVHSDTRGTEVMSQNPDAVMEEWRSIGEYDRVDLVANEYVERAGRPFWELSFVGYWGSFMVRMQLYVCDSPDGGSYGLLCIETDDSPTGEYTPVDEMVDTFRLA
jgi:hypothetical protein